MKLLRNLLDRTGEVIKKNAKLKSFYYLYEATDEFFFGTNKVTTVPHITSGLDIKRVMAFVVLAMMPATLGAVYFYGWRILAVIAVSYAVGGIVEVAFSYYRRKPIYEGFLVTGLIFPLVLPPTIPLWQVGVGIFFGTFFGKEVFGGTGRNIFNPALVGRVFLSLAFPENFATMWQVPFVSGLGGFVKYTSDAVTSATPLINFKSTGVIESYWNLFVGTHPGTIGEVFRIGILLGGIPLMLARISSWRITLSCFASVVVFSFLGSIFMPGIVAPPLFQLLSGGLLFGAFFMATDPVSGPLSLEGKWIYGILIGLLTVVIRSLTGFAEGFMFAVLLMNAVGPFIDSIVVEKKFKPVTIE